MKRAIFQDLDVMTSTPRPTNRNYSKNPGIAQQQAEREARLARALRENLLRRKEQMRARIQKIEESLIPMQPVSEEK